jgi:hypothetical protein
VISPADELRTAAETLRHLAIAASTDPHSNRPTAVWEFRPWKREFPTDFPPNGTLAAPDADGRNRSLIHRGSPGAGAPWMFEAHGAYIAAMGPNVGALLADWLDSAAEDAEQIGPDPHALAVARAITTHPTP